MDSGQESLGIGRPGQYDITTREGGKAVVPKRDPGGIEPYPMGPRRGWEFPLRAFELRGRQG
jgi:hypothetical protein